VAAGEKANTPATKPTLPTTLTPGALSIIDHCLVGANVDGDYEFTARLNSLRCGGPHEFGIKGMNARLPRALIMAHYDRDGLIDPHVLYSLKAYRSAFAHVTFVSVSADRLPPGYENLVDTFIRRDNIGYDFGSWKIGFNTLIAKDRFVEIVFVNDSIYGPFFDIEHALLSPNVKDADFWGLTSSYEIAWHIQSFFFSMRHRLLSGGLAQRWWDMVRLLEYKDEIINRYEIPMADHFRQQGCATEAIYATPFPARIPRATICSGCDIREPLQSARRIYYNRWVTTANPMHVLWHPVIEAGVPFVKVELLRDNPYRLPLRPVFDYLHRNTRYPMELISAHLRRVAGISA
jgi:lipopolysaccharide biosynthesis protein